MLHNRRNQMVIGAVVLLGLLAVLQHWFGMYRPKSAWLRAAQEFIVTSSADRGPGSLREAIFAADSAADRARLILRSDRIVLESSLPPLVNPLGVIVEADGVDSEIDARNIGGGPVFDIDAPNSAISNLKIRSAPEQAVLVRKDGFRLLNVTVTGSDVGLYAAEGVSDLLAENSRFERNRIGILLTTGSSGIVLRNNKFSGHQDAAVWAVRSDRLPAPTSQQVQLKGNYFEGDRFSIVLGNFPALVEANDFFMAKEAAVYLLGTGAVVKGNRIRNGAGVGIFAHTTQGVVIEGNEVNHNQTLAVLVRSSQDAVVQSNRLYSNGYGIAFVLGENERPNIATENIVISQQFDGIILIGDSPLIQGNRVLNNRLAGLRILDFLPSTGSRVASDPFLANNILNGNKLNDPIRGEYRVRAVKTAK